MRLADNSERNMKKGQNMKIVKSTQTGMVRKNNQDNYLVKQSKELGVTLLMVLDGVGGSNAGEVASATVSNLFGAYFEGLKEKDSLEGYKTWALTALEEINEEVYRLSHQKNQFVGMSTTCVIGFFSPYGQFFINVGDSRFYMIDHRDELIQLSTDHTLVNDLLVKGSITVEEAHNHPMKHALTNAIGIYPKLRSEYHQIQMPYKKILLCTDGLSGYVDHEVIQEILTNPDLSLNDQKNKLNQAVNDAGAIDNFTFIIMEV